MKRTIAIITTILLFGIVSPLISYGADKEHIESQESNTIQRIKSRGILLVGTTGDYRPLTFKEEDGRYWGFGIEMAEAIAKKLEVEVQFVQTSWPTLTNDVLADQQTFDLAIGGITITDQRKETMLMSDGYLANGKTEGCP